MAEIASEEQAIGTAGAVGGEKAQLRHADILGLVDDAILERRVRSRLEVVFQALKHLGFGEKPSFGEPVAHLGEDRPEHGALCLRQSRLATKAHDVPVGLPALKLPRVDHPAPFGPEEMRAELVILRFRLLLGLSAREPPRRKPG